jgi:AcrR family transcriptional regulator
MYHLTQKAILDAFVRLLSERPLDKITVTDVANECQITRRTFYYHFHDLFEVVETLLRMETERAVEEFEAGMSWQDCFIRASRFILDNRTAVYHLYRSSRREELERFLDRLFMQIMRQYLTEVSAGHNLKESDAHLICQFYKNALYGLVLEWLDGGMQTDPEQVIRRLGLLFDGHIMRSIEISEQN